MSMLPSTHDDNLFDFTTPTTPVITSTALDPNVQQGETVIVQQGTSMPMPVIGGKVVGEAKWTAISVYMAQLVIDPNYSLRKGWGLTKDERAKDEEYQLLVESIRQSAGNLEPMLVEWTGKTVPILGEEYPEFRVRSGTRRYWALDDLGLSHALVRVLSADVDEKERLIECLIQNETRQELPTLDKCDLVTILSQQYKMKQHVIAARVGYSQAMVAKLLAAGAQSPRIRAYLSQKSLNLEDVYYLSMIADVNQRELAARYCVQNGWKAKPKKIEDLKNALNVPDAAGGPTCVLLTSGNDVVIQDLNNGVTDAAEKPAPKETPYWKRTSPLYASPVRLLNNRHILGVQGTRERPQIEVQSLHIVRFVQQLLKQKVAIIDFEALEEACLADLEAGRMAIEELADLDADRATAADDEDLDADVFEDLRGIK
jgi:ParB/RepB/Spo0J family partition protein